MHLSTGVTSRSSLSYRLRLRRASSNRLRCRVKSKTLCFGGKYNDGRRRSHERLLRYPNGDTRLIRYPATESEAEPEVVDTNADARSSQLPPRPASTSVPLKTSNLPSSPAELVRLIRSSSYIKAQKEHQQRIRESYQILESSPWPTEQRVYVLTVTDVSLDTLHMYTLRTRLHQKAATNRLKRMFRGPDFEGEFLQVDRMADGVITFLDLDNAERFKALVEAEETKQVEICEMSSGTLFLGCLDAKAIVIWMQLHDYCPTVHELATSLKAHQSLEGGDV